MSSMATREKRDPFELVVSWRLEQLMTAGYSRREATLLSERSDIDLHVATSLAARGCPVETALRILL